MIGVRLIGGLTVTKGWRETEDPEKKHPISRSKKEVRLFHKQELDHLLNAVKITAA